MLRKIATDCKQSLFNSEEQFEVKCYYSNSFETKVTYKNISQAQVRNSTFCDSQRKCPAPLLWKQHKFCVMQFHFYTNGHPSERARIEGTLFLPATNSELCSQDSANHSLLCVSLYSSPLQIGLIIFRNPVPCQNH